MISMIGGLVIGVHMASAHFPSHEWANNNNPGIYFRTESGWTGGAYRNTLRQTSAHAGYTLTSGPASLTLGVVSGYQTKGTARREVACNNGHVPIEGETSRCFQEARGAKGKKVALLIAPSIRGPEFYGIAPRLTILPRLRSNGFSVVHLSVERSFD